MSGAGVARTQADGPAGRGRCVEQERDEQQPVAATWSREGHGDGSFETVARNSGLTEGGGKKRSRTFGDITGCGQSSTVTDRQKIWPGICLSVCLDPRSCGAHVFFRAGLFGPFWTWSLAAGHLVHVPASWFSACACSRTVISSFAWSLVWKAMSALSLLSIWPGPGFIVFLRTFPAFAASDTVAVMRCPIPGCTDLACLFDHQCNRWVCGHAWQPPAAFGSWGSKRSQAVM